MDNSEDTGPAARIKQAREQAVADAHAVGVNPAFISRLVDRFYERIRADEVLAPIFASRIKPEDWPRHMMTMKRFWASVILNAGIYSGKPMLVHKQVDMIREAHFDRWLALFEFTLRDIAPSDAAIELFMEKAQRIAESLKLGLFYHI